eukprot:Opistho-2@72288
MRPARRRCHHLRRPHHRRRRQGPRNHRTPPRPRLPPRPPQRPPRQGQLRPPHRRHHRLRRQGMALRRPLMNAPIPNLTHWKERCEMAAAFRWTAHLGMNEAVANHFSLATNAEGTRFLINPNGRHFARITASSLIEIDANDPETMNRPDA